jgi:hypothetical protein
MRKPWIVSLYLKHKKSTHRSKGSDLPIVDVIHRNPTLLIQITLRPTISNLLDTVDTTVPVLEVHGRRPVVGLVLRIRARCARRAGEAVGRGHVEFKGVAADNLVRVRCVRYAGEDEGIGSLDDELRAREAKHAGELGRGGLGQEDQSGGKGEADHVGQVLRGRGCAIQL